MLQAVSLASGAGSPGSWSTDDFCIDKPFYKAGLPGLDLKVVNALPRRITSVGLIRFTLSEFFGGRYLQIF